MPGLASANPVIAAAIKEIEAQLQPTADGGRTFTDDGRRILERITSRFLTAPELAGFVQGLLDLADRLAADPRSEAAGQVIFTLLDRQDVVEAIEALVAAAEHFRKHNTTITPEMDKQMRDGMTESRLQGSRTLLGARAGQLGLAGTKLRG